MSINIYTKLYKPNIDYLLLYCQLHKISKYLMSLLSSSITDFDAVLAYFSQMSSTFTIHMHNSLLHGIAGTWRTLTMAMSHDDNTIDHRLHWLDVPERIKYKLSMMMRRCLNGTAPQYLAAHCVLVSATASRQHLRSAASHQLVVPSYRLSSYGRRSFSVAGLAP